MDSENPRYNIHHTSTGRTRTTPLYNYIRRILLRERGLSKFGAQDSKTDQKERNEKKKPTQKSGAKKKNLLFVDLIPKDMLSNSVPTIIPKLPPTHPSHLSSPPLLFCLIRHAQSAFMKRNQLITCFFALPTYHRILVFNLTRYFWEVRNCYLLV